MLLIKQIYEFIDFMVDVDDVCAPSLFLLHHTRIVHQAHLRPSCAVVEFSPLFGAHVGVTREGGGRGVTSVVRWSVLTQLLFFFHGVGR